MNFSFHFIQILDRKNMELEEIKSHYRNKITEMEAAAKKQERKSEKVVIFAAHLLDNERANKVLSLLRN